MPRKHKTTYTKAQQDTFITLVCKKITKWGFQFGIDIACTEAGISKEQCLEWIVCNPRYQQRIDKAEQRMVERCVNEIKQAANNGDTEAQRWLTEHGYKPRDAMVVLFPKGSRVLH